jgi:hypothetical protein
VLKANLCFCVKAVDPSDVEGEQKSDGGSPLRLLVFMSSSGSLQGQYIIGDGCIIKVDTRRSTAFGVMALLMSYYVFEINYP